MIGNLKVLRLTKLLLKINHYSTMNNSERLGIVWFRNDLRIHDNTALHHALDLIKQKKIDKIIPFYCFEKDFFEGVSRTAQIPRTCTLKNNFIIESVLNLKENLIKTVGSNLYVSYGQPELEIMKLIDEVSSTNTGISLDIVIASKGKQMKRF